MPPEKPLTRLGEVFRKARFPRAVRAGNDDMKSCRVKNPLRQPCELERQHAHEAGGGAQAPQSKPGTGALDQIGGGWDPGNDSLGDTLSHTSSERGLDLPRELVGVLARE
jgi:hypothetical protein